MTRPLMNSLERSLARHARASAIAIICLTVLLSLVLTAITSTPAGAQSNRFTTSFTLDGLSLTVHTQFLPASTFQTSKPGNASQEAVATRSDPFQELTVTAVPYGSHPITEQLPNATANGTAPYRAALRNYRAQQGGTPATGPAVSLFGQRVTGTQSLVKLTLGAAKSQPVVIVDWVGESASRLWIVRASEQLPVGSSIGVASTWLRELNGLTITAQNQARTTITATSPFSYKTMAHQPTQTYSCNDLGCVSWWTPNPKDPNGDKTCDPGHNPGSHLIGIGYDGLIACAPNDDYEVVPAAGGAGEYEWECVELAMRYLYLRFQEKPYLVDHNQASNVFSQYPGGTLRKSQATP